MIPLASRSRRATRARTSNLESVNKHGDRDELEGSSLLEDSVVQGLVKDNVVLSLILHLLGGPLLLSGLSSGHGGGGLSGLGLLHFRGTGLVSVTRSVARVIEHRLKNECRLGTNDIERRNTEKQKHKHTDLVDPLLFSITSN